jgi:hypothetical protein
MQWLTEPRVLIRVLMHGVSPDVPAAYVPDTESYWGVNDRFAVVSRPAAAAYFTERGALRATHTGNTETLHVLCGSNATTCDDCYCCCLGVAACWLKRRGLDLRDRLAAVLKAARVAVRFMPTLGTLKCCGVAHECHARTSSGVRQWLWVNGSSELLCVKYVFEAQAAVQNAEALTARAASLVACPGGTSACERPANARSPHHCAPRQALCVRPAPEIEWRALWRAGARNRSSADWYRWIGAPPWRASLLRRLGGVL